MPHKAHHNARRLSVIFALVLLAAVARLGPLAQGQSANSQAPKPWGQNPNGMHIYIWAGLKSHFPGQHDYPQFLADWSKLLTEHGAVVDGACTRPLRPTSRIPTSSSFTKATPPTSATKRRPCLKPMSSVAAGWSACTIRSADPIPHTSPPWSAAPRNMARLTTRSERRSRTQWWIPPTPS